VLAQPEDLFCSSPTPPARRLGVHKELEGTQLGQLTPTDQKSIPYYMMSCSAHKSGGRRRKSGKFGVMVFVCPSKHYTQWSPALLEMAERLPADRKQ